MSWSVDCVPATTTAALTYDQFSDFLLAEFVANYTWTEIDPLGSSVYRD